MYKSLPCDSAKRVVFGVLTVLLTVGWPDFTSAQTQEIKQEHAPYSITDIKNIGPVPGTTILSKKDLKDTGWFAKGLWVLNWLYAPKSFDSSWPLYMYDPKAITKTCNELGSNNEQLLKYNVGYGVLVVPKNSKNSENYIGIPLRATDTQQLVKFAPLLAGSISRNAEPGKIQLAKKGSTNLTTINVLRLPEKVKQTKFESSLASFVNVYRKSISSTEKPGAPLTLKDVCGLFETRSSDDPPQVLLATEQPVLDTDLSARLEKRASFATLGGSNPG